MDKIRYAFAVAGNAALSHVDGGIDTFQTLREIRGIFTVLTAAAEKQRLADVTVGEGKAQAEAARNAMLRSVWPRLQALGYNTDGSADTSAPQEPEPATDLFAEMRSLADRLEDRYGGAR